MPVYEYKCEKCGHQFEVQQSHKDKRASKCVAPGCGGSIKRLFSPPALVFKGKGFHVNDYKRSGATAPKATPSCPNAASCPSGTCPAAGGD